MSMQSGARAAQRSGVATAAMQTGPRGGHFYFNSHGKKTYGTPPAGHAEPARAAKSPKTPPRGNVPSHLSPGARIHADLEGEGWLKGTVVSVNLRKKTVRVKLADGGHADVPFEATKAHREDKPTPPPRAHKPPTPATKPATTGAEIGKHVEADLEGEGWVKGHITKIYKGHVIVALHDGTHAKVPHQHIRAVTVEKPAAQSFDKMVKAPIEGRLPFKNSFAEAVVKGGFGPLLARDPLSALTEGGTGHASALGVYWSLSGKIATLKVTDMQTMANREHAGLIGKFGIGPNVHNVGNVHPTGDQMTTGTLIHEMGHHLHLSPNNAHIMKSVGGEAGAKSFDDQIFGHWYKQTAQGHPFHRAEREGWVPSVYSKTNHKEWFAEAHTAYVMHHDEFKYHDPEGHDLVRRIRKANGME